MAADPLNTTFVKAPASPLVKPVEFDTAATEYGKSGNDFKKVYSDSLQNERSARSAEKTPSRDEAASTAQAERQAGSNNTNQRIDERRAEPSAPTADTNSTAKTANQPEQSPPEDSTTELDTEAVSPEAIEKPQNEKPIPEGAPPAEFVAALLASDPTIVTEVDTSQVDKAGGIPTESESSTPTGLVESWVTGNEETSSEQNTGQFIDPTASNDKGAETGSLTNGQQQVQSGANLPDAVTANNIAPIPNSDSSTTDDTTTNRSTDASKTNNPTPAVSVSTTGVDESETPELQTAATNGQSESHKSESANSSTSTTQSDPTAMVAADGEESLTAAQIVPKAESATTPQEQQASQANSTEETDSVQTVTEGQGSEESSGQAAEGDDSSDQDNSGQQRQSTLGDARNDVPTGEDSSQSAAALTVEEDGPDTNGSIVIDTTTVGKSDGGGSTPTTAGATDSQTVVDVNQPDFVGRVAQAVQSSADQRQQVTMRLTPPELGTLQIEVTVEHGKVSARIDTQSSVTQKILLDSLPQLKEALSHNGAQVERLEVALTDHSPDDREQQLGHNLSQQGGQGGSAADDGPSGFSGTETEETTMTSQDDEQADSQSPIRKSRAAREIDITI